MEIHPTVHNSVSFSYGLTGAKSRSEVRTLEIRLSWDRPDTIYAGPEVPMFQRRARILLNPQRPIVLFFDVYNPLTGRDVARHGN
jgi:hypothetical protein